MLATPLINNRIDDTKKLSCMCYTELVENFVQPQWESNLQPQECLDIIHLELPGIERTRTSSEISQ